MLFRSNSHKKCRVCVGILCDKETDLNNIEKELKNKYTVSTIDFTRGVSFKTPNINPHHSKHDPKGLAVYMMMEKYILGNSDMKDSLKDSPGYEDGEIQFIEIVTPFDITYYRPLHNAGKFIITELPPLKDDKSKKND